MAKITKKETKKTTKKDVLSRIKRMKDSTLEIDLKELEFTPTRNEKTFYYNWYSELEGVKVRVQIFVK